MRDVLDQLLPWVRAGQRFALATVVGTWSSAPRQPGAAMAVSADGQAVGSVSGGCVEGAVYELAEQVLATGTPVLARYGVSDDDAYAVGLTCGGIIDVFVEPVVPPDHGELAVIARDVAAHRPVALATVVAGPGPVGARMLVWPEEVSGSLGNPRLDAAVVDDARGMLQAGATGLLHLGPDGQRRLDELTVFVESFAPPAQMYVFGAIDFAAAVARIGKFLGYRVTVCDARGIFATRSRFPDADEVVVAWPHRFLASAPVDARSVMCVLTHDPKFDVPLLEAALRTPAAYIGAMGSRRTHAERLAGLRQRGVPEESLARIAAPIGLDIGARTPEETAVSIAAEIIAARWGGTGERLAGTEGPIHRPTTG
ncbi:MAG: XdhC family protein [Actinomycetes bacterium]